MGSGQQRQGPGGGGMVPPGGIATMMPGMSPGMGGAFPGMGMGSAPGYGGMGSAPGYGGMGSAPNYGGMVPPGMGGMTTQPALPTGPMNPAQTSPNQAGLMQALQAQQRPNAVRGDFRPPVFSRFAPEFLQRVEAQRQQEQQQATDPMRPNAVRGDTRPMPDLSAFMGNANPQPGPLQMYLNRQSLPPRGPMPIPPNQRPNKPFEPQKGGGMSGPPNRLPPRGPGM